MGLKDTGRVNDEATAGAGRGRAIKRDPDDKGPLNPSATAGAGRGYVPVRLGVRAVADKVSYNKTKVEIRPRVDPVVASGPSCGNLRVFTKTIAGVVTVVHSAGQVGAAIFAEDEIGALSSVLGDYVCAKVVMNDSNGSTVETVEAFSSIPAATDTTSYLLLATISAEGVITQQACGPLVVLTCRNFYAAAAPFYSLYLALN